MAYITAAKFCYNNYRHTIVCSLQFLLLSAIDAIRFTDEIILFSFNKRAPRWPHPNIIAPHLTTLHFFVDKQIDVVM
jgi:hypothetical protein